MAEPNMELTTSEKKLIRAYRSYSGTTGKDPSQNWLAAELGVNVNSVRWAMRKLKEKGFMTEKKVTTKRLVLSAKGKRVEL